jgi:hypothetical protein
MTSEKLAAIPTRQLRISWWIRESSPMRLPVIRSASFKNISFIDADHHQKETSGH